MKKKKRPYVMSARASKAAETKARIRLSAMQLYCERPLDAFTLEEVARRAGTTVQTVLRAFGSKESVIYAGVEELAAGGVPLRQTPPGDIVAGVHAIYELYESIGDLTVRRLADEQSHPALKKLLDEGRQNQCEAVRLIFAPQLAAEKGAARAQLLHALIAVTDVYVWKVLRRDLKLSLAAAEAIVCRIVTGLTRGEKSHGQDPVAELVGRRQPSA